MSEVTVVVECARAIVGGEERRDFAFVMRGPVHSPNATIIATGTIEDIRASYPHEERRVYGDQVVIVPGFINGHSHAYQILLRGWADDCSFERWRNEALYRIVPQLTPDDIDVIFWSAFREMLANGITTVVEFFYLNGRGTEHLDAAIRAAKAVGIRLVVARTWMDAGYAPALFRETIDGAARDTQRIMEAHPDIMICPAPHSLHAASPDMIREAVAFARAHDVPTHMHVAEAQYESDQIQARTGMTPVRHLSDLSALYDRFVAVHAIYVDDEEKKMLADAGASIVHNPMTNQYLGDGICDIVRYSELGVPIALGTDADVHPSIIEEMRAAALLQKVARRSGDAIRARDVWAMGTAQGARALHLAAGDFQVGMYADYLAVALGSESLHPWTPTVNGIVYAGEASWITDRNVGFVDHLLNEVALVRRDPRGDLRRIQERLSF